MFVSNLNPEQQQVLLHYAQKIVHADGSVVCHEQDYLKVMKAQFSADTVEALESNCKFDLQKILPGKKSKISFLVELLGVAYADGNYHNTEKSIIVDLAKELNIETVELKCLTSWVQRQHHMLSEVNFFMEE